MTIKRVDTTGFREGLKAGQLDGLVLCKRGPADIRRASGTRDSDRTLTWTISTAAVDRHGDVIDQEGWDLDNFTRGGSILWNHCHDMPPVARPIETWVDNGTLKGTAKFASQSTSPFAHMIYELSQKGYIRSSSVGFLPRKWQPLEESGSQWGPQRFTAQELLEWSPVSVPANPEALQDARSCGINLEPLRSYCGRLLDGGQTTGLWLSKDYAEHVWRVTGDAPVSAEVKAAPVFTEPSQPPKRDEIDTEGRQALAYVVKSSQKKLQEIVARDCFLLAETLATLNVHCVDIEPAREEALALRDVITLAFDEKPASPVAAPPIVESVKESYVLDAVSADALAHGISSAVRQAFRRAAGRLED